MKLVSRPPDRKKNHIWQNVILSRKSCSKVTSSLCFWQENIWVKLWWTIASHLPQRNSDGALQFYKDGALSTHSSCLNGLEKGYEIRAGVSLVLEREQDSLGGGYRGSQFLLSHLKKNLNGRSCLSYQNDPKGLNVLPCRGRELFPMEPRQLWGQRKNRGCHSISVRSTEMIPLRNNSEFKMSGQSK